MVSKRPKRASAHRRRGNPNAPDDLVGTLRTHARSKDLEVRVGDGWLPLVRACHEAVAAEFPNYELLAVKQKYGELAFQARPLAARGPESWTDDERQRLHDIVEHFREASASVCEECGRLGDMRYIDGYELVLCDECFSARSR
jgi:hypothetical protein